MTTRASGLLTKIFIQIEKSASLPGSLLWWLLSSGFFFDMFGTPSGKKSTLNGDSGLLQLARRTLTIG